MKCIKTESGKIERLKDKEIDLLAKKGKVVYAKKSEWRKTDPEWASRSGSQKKAEEKINKGKFSGEIA